MNKDYPSDELINAFVDGELEHQERLELLNAAVVSDEIRQKICQTQHLKELVSDAFPLPAPQKIKVKSRRFRMMAVAASLSAMALVSYFFTQPPSQPLTPLTAQSSQQQSLQTRVVFHISSDDGDLARQMMEQVELVLDDYAQKGQNIRVEVVANNQGIRLFQEGRTPIFQQISDLHDRYSNVVFAACANTMERFEKQTGETINIVPQVVIIRSGVSFVARRQQMGWAYIKV
jgi:hypothetical protein